MASPGIVGRGGGKGGWNYRWYYDSLTPTLATFTAKMVVATGVVMEQFAQEVEAYAKENASWEDRTGAARDGLSATTDYGLSGAKITLAHSVPYGIWLEIRWSGQYAIILPTIEVMGPRLMLELKGVFAVL